MLKKPVSYCNQHSSIFSGLLAGQRAERPTSFPPVIASAISPVVFFDDTSWRSPATALLVKLGLFSSLLRSKSVTTCSSIFCPLYRFRRNVSAAIHCHCKIVTWMFLDLAATSSSLIFASFAFLRLLEPLGKSLHLLRLWPPSVHDYLLIRSIRLRHLVAKREDNLWLSFAWVYHLHQWFSNFSARWLPITVYNLL